jgi:hypothetical protein
VTKALNSTCVDLLDPELFNSLSATVTPHLPALKALHPATVPVLMASLADLHALQHDDNLSEQLCCYVTDVMEVVNTQAREDAAANQRVLRDIMEFVIAKDGRGLDEYMHRSVGNFTVTFFDYIDRTVHNARQDANDATPKSVEIMSSIKRLALDYVGRSVSRGATVLGEVMGFEKHEDVVGAVRERIGNDEALGEEVLELVKSAEEEFEALRKLGKEEEEARDEAKSEGGDNYNSAAAGGIAGSDGDVEAVEEKVRVVGRIVGELLREIRESKK